ncbi:AAA domain-containing protein [Cognataquiflexum rubidum]|uniref:AAA domain-containing protein n=1 Tax=Cognataquiflexum rubidum TaxID=2922273 RepID=UPI001F1341E2|nr:AAA domain-containing protein [Cognataquiflexum rubidum]MCH6235213.1 AAA domain-containing protein [Cognataquiflexum rubidum]
MLKDILQIYLNRLLDLSSRNRSIYLPRLIPSQMIDLNDLDFLNHRPAFGLVESLLGKDKNVTLIPFADPRDAKVNVLSQRLNRLEHLVKTAETETGEKSLFVGWPFVEGKLLNDQVIRCPLIFFPVELKKSENQWGLKKNGSDVPFFNKAFLLAYAYAYGKDHHYNGEENPLENFATDPIGFRNDLYALLKEEFALNFSSELYENKISTFPDSSKSLDEERLKTGKLQLKPYAVLGQFSQKASFLIQDYEDLIAGEEFPDLESLFHKWFAPEEEQPISVREDQLYTVFPVDASQEEVIKSVREGRSCVVEGPPGTGKSQLISNLAIDFVSRGKKVLIVSQKRAALDVVFKRLSNEGFGSFLSLVHDFRADRKALYKKIHDQILSLDRYQELNRGIDAIQLERQFSQYSRLIDYHSDYFSGLKKALFNTEECGIPVKELYLGSKLSDEAFDMNQYYRRFHAGRVNDFLRDFKTFAGLFRTYQNPESFWLHRVDFSSFGAEVSKRIQEVMSEIHHLKLNFEKDFSHLTSFEVSFLFSFFEQKQRILDLQKLLKEEEILALFWSLKDLPSGEVDLLWLEHKFEAIKSLFAEQGIEWHSKDGEVENSLRLSLEFLERKKGWRKNIPLLWKKKRFHSVYRLLFENNLQANAHGIQILIKKLENRLNLNHQYSILKEKDWIQLPVKPFDFNSFNHISTRYTEAAKAKQLFLEFGLLKEILIENLQSGIDFVQRLKLVNANIGELEAKIPYWSLYLSKIQIQHLITESTGDGILSLKTQVTTVFPDLVVFDRLRSKLKEQDVMVMEKMLATYPNQQFEELKALFLAGLKLSWIGHIETKYPLLQDVVTDRTKQMQEEMMEAVLEKWKLSKYIAEIRLRENTYKNLEHNRLGNLLTYRELSHQVSKQKRIWSIKKLVENFEKEIFQLVPCWLASPETVSALFPLKQSFDLVIFDESSQCYVERGLPAMLRGKQAVIAGDSNQLRPFDLYQVRLETEDEGIETETESLLELASSYFQKFWLQGHYRSEQLPLIYFSNKNFYENKLKMLTKMDLVNEAVNPFKWKPADGIWENQVNVIEAEAVLDEIKLIQETNPEQTIGVITFNFFQMEYIRGLVSKDPKIQQENLSIKNIENVQGDEFDWVIFCIGYAKNRKGKLIANFGMLSKKGGINRLNVAISRAKRKITLISSIKPGDFNSDQLKNEGIKMLRDYLNFVIDICEGKVLAVPAPIPYRFESGWSLKDKIEGDYQGFSLEQFPSSRWMDLAVKVNGQYKEALLTDDQRLYDSSSAKEAFVYHSLQLKEKGWPYKFYYSRQYWMEKPILGE